MEKDPRQQKIIEDVQQFADKEIRPYATEFDKKGKLPKNLIKKLADKKFLSASFPSAYGGLELNPIYYGLFTEAIGKACCSTRSLITINTSLVGENILRWGTDKQKDKWLKHIASGNKLGAFALSEVNVGSDAKAVQSTYTESKGSYIINGRKKWISFGALADFFVVIARCKNDITAFIVERDSEGIRSKPIEGMLASRASYIAEVDFQDVRVGKENILGGIGNGFTFIVNTALDHGRYSIAWGGVAIAQEAVEAMVKYSRERKQFGKKIHEFQLIQGMIADAVTKIHAARALCLRAGEMRKNRDSQAITETTIAKYFASKVAMEVAMDAVQVHGGNGCCNNYPVERLFREAKLLEIIEGTSQIQQVIIAQYGLRKYYKFKNSTPARKRKTS